MDTEKAYLSNDKDMIQFRYGDKIIRFRGPYSLERFISIKEWDNLAICNGKTEQCKNCSPQIYWIGRIRLWLNGKRLIFLMFWQIRVI